MKTFLLALHLIILLSNISFSQNGWVFQNSNTNKKLNEVFFINEQKGWIVTDSSKILRTTDGGFTWSLQTLPYYSPLNSIFFINENTGWAAGGYYYIAHFGVIFKTTNGGNNWNLLTYSGNVQSICFIDENTGFIGLDHSWDFESRGTLSKTTNGGANWDMQFSNDNHIISGITFKNSDTGFALGHYWDDTSNDSSIIYRTTNTGSSWEIKYKEKNSFSFYSALKDISVKGNNVWAAGRDSSILYSSNNGENWIHQYIPNPRIMNSIFFIDNYTGWAVGMNNSDTSTIIKTTNSGLNWVNLKSNFSNRLHSVIFVNANTGWTVGEYGIILKTITGGLTNIKNNVLQTPSEYFLYQNYPNPFNPVTVIRYSLSENRFITLRVFDTAGKEIKTLMNSRQNDGVYSADFNGQDYPSGIYYYSLYANEKLIDTRKMVLIK